MTEINGKTQADTDGFNTHHWNTDKGNIFSDMFKSINRKCSKCGMVVMRFNTESYWAVLRRKGEKAPFALTCSDYIMKGVLE